MSLRSDLKNVGERMGWTFVETFLAVFAFTDVSTLRNAAVAAAAAAVVPLKEFAKSRTGA